jgi:hypothetical protein
MIDGCSVRFLAGTTTELGCPKLRGFRSLGTIGADPVQNQKSFANSLFRNILPTTHFNPIFCKNGNGSKLPNPYGHKNLEEVSLKKM